MRSINFDLDAQIVHVVEVKRLNLYISTAESNRLHDILPRSVPRIVCDNFSASESIACDVSVVVRATSATPRGS